MGSDSKMSARVRRRGMAAVVIALVVFPGLNAERERRELGRPEQLERSPLAAAGTPARRPATRAETAGAGATRGSAATGSRAGGSSRGAHSATPGAMASEGTRDASPQHVTAVDATAAFPTTTHPAPAPAAQRTTVRSPGATPSTTVQPSREGQPGPAATPAGDGKATCRAWVSEASPRPGEEVTVLVTSNVPSAGVTVTARYWAATVTKSGTTDASGSASAAVPAGHKSGERVPVVVRIGDKATCDTSFTPR